MLNVLIFFSNGMCQMTSLPPAPLFLKERNVLSFKIKHDVLLLYVLLPIAHFLWQPHVPAITRMLLSF